MKTILLTLILTLSAAAQSRPSTAIQTGPPFSAQGEIVTDQNGRKIERNIMADTVKYEIYYEDGSAAFLAKKGGHLDSLEPNDRWRVRCNKDAMSDDVSCDAFLHDLAIRIRRWRNGFLYSVIIGTDHYPGSRVAIRFDDDPPILGGRSQPFAFDNPQAILERLLTAKKVTTRYRKWPREGDIDSTWEVYGAREVIEYLKWAVVRIK